MWPFPGFSSLSLRACKSWVAKASLCSSMKTEFFVCWGKGVEIRQRKETTTRRGFFREPLLAPRFPMHGLKERRGDGNQLLSVGFSYSSFPGPAFMPFWQSSFKTPLISHIFKSDINLEWGAYGMLAVAA